MNRAPQISFLVMGLMLAAGHSAVGEENAPAWVQTGTRDAEEAHQAAAADERFIYAINNRVVAKYDRATGERVANSTGDAHHLNSGFLCEGKLYCAHSNFPRKPEVSIIKAVDLETMELRNFHGFGHSPHGSLTVAVYEDNAWWCVFAVYGKGDNARTALVKFDAEWNELGVWRFPGSVVSDLGTASISGGIWKDGYFLATGHDKRVIYRLTLPESGGELRHVATHPSPFPGQGIAYDPKTGGLVGINRKWRQVVFAELATE